MKKCIYCNGKGSVCYDKEKQTPPTNCICPLCLGAKEITDSIYHKYLNIIHQKDSPQF